MSLNEAINFARSAHASQKRSISGQPYIDHPLAVLSILQQDGVTNQDVLIAAVLHDVLEDTSVSSDIIRGRFGQQVLNYVREVTHPESGSWKQKRELSLERIASGSVGAKLIKCADRLANTNDMIKELQTLGPAMWDHFHKPVSDHEWYLRESLVALRNLGHRQMYKDLQRNYVMLFRPDQMRA